MFTYWPEILITIRSGRIAATYDLSDPINISGFVEGRVASVLRVAVGRAANVRQEDNHPIHPLGELLSDHRIATYNKHARPSKSAMKKSIGAIYGIPRCKKKPKDSKGAVLQSQEESV